MKHYEIAFKEWANERVGEFVEFAILYVQAGNIKCPVRITASGTLKQLFINRGNADKLRESLMLVGIPKIIDALNEMDMPLVPVNTYIIQQDFNSDDYSELERALGLKTCTFQSRSKGGLICEASSKPDDRKTSEAVCLACNLPDDKVRCSRLQHPSILARTGIGKQRRLVADAFCAIRTDTFDSSKCHPGGHECWRMQIDAREDPVTLPPDIGERIIDELHFINLSFHKAFGRDVWLPNDIRTVANILLRCNSQEEFVFRIAALSDLMKNLQTGEVLDNNGKPIEGTLNRLERFLTINGNIPSLRFIGTFRRINDLRNSFPIHSGSRQRFIAAAEQLGIPTDNKWPLAWDFAKYRFWQALREFREALS